MKQLLFIMMLLISSQMMAQNENFIQKISPYSFEKSINNLKYWLKHHKIKIFSEIDHSNEAEKVGLALPKIKLFIVGNPKVGTMLMQENQDIALHLPLKILIKENTNGKTEILYQKIQILAIENGLEKSLPIAKKIDEGIDNLLESVVSKGEQ